MLTLYLPFGVSGGLGSPACRLSWNGGNWRNLSLRVYLFHIVRNALRPSGWSVICCLISCLSHLRTRIDEGRVSCVGRYHSALFALGKIDIPEAGGARLRSRTQWVEDGEVSSSFFFRLEKKNQADRWVAALKNADGSIRLDMDRLICILSGFYSSFFSADETLRSTQDFLLSNLERSLDPEQALL